jgi:hypothetical protein
MVMRPVQGEVCPDCAADVVERSVDGLVLGRSCVNASCRWRQYSALRRPGGRLSLA